MRTLCIRQTPKNQLLSWFVFAKFQSTNMLVRASAKNERSVTKDNDSGSPALDRRHSTVETSHSNSNWFPQRGSRPRIISDNGALDCCKKLVENAFGFKFYERSSFGDIG